MLPCSLSKTLVGVCVAVFALKNCPCSLSKTLIVFPVVALKNPGRGLVLIVCTLKNPGEGFCCLGRSQKPWGFCVERVRSQKPLVGRVLTVLALKICADRVRSQKPW